MRSPRGRSWDAGAEGRSGGSLGALSGCLPFRQALDHGALAQEWALAQRPPGAGQNAALPAGAAGRQVINPPETSASSLAKWAA